MVERNNKTRIDPVLLLHGQWTPWAATDETDLINIKSSRPGNVAGVPSIVFCSGVLQQCTNYVKFHGVLKKTIIPPSLSLSLSPFEKWYQIHNSHFTRGTPTCLYVDRFESYYEKYHWQSSCRCQCNRCIEYVTVRYRSRYFDREKYRDISIARIQLRTQYNR